MASSSDEEYSQQLDTRGTQKSSCSSSSSSQDEDFIEAPSHSNMQGSSGNVNYNQYNGVNSTMNRRRSSSSSTSQEEEHSEPLPPKRAKGTYSNKAMRMMGMMGYDPEKGLGKAGQGRLEPVEASTQEGRRGLGLKLDGLDAAAIKWSPEMEEITIPEQMDWLVNEDEDLYALTMQDLAEWVIIGGKKLTIDDETKFCDQEVLENVLSSKSIFDNLGANDMRRARTRSNPFETIRGAIFLNRAAVKMANMDSLCDFMFTKPIDKHGNSLVKENDLLYFADVCAGPGGFSEYVLFRKQWEAKGFGFTLRGENDFKLNDFFAGPPETFDPYYGVKDDGNVFDPKNIQSFTDYVLKQTETGVHFVMADGGFSVEGQENIQEILSKQLYLCQCLVALSILRENGHFVVKLFDLFTPFSVGLIYLMFKCFEEICICKPNTSRPANSERYLICKWKKAHTDTIRRHLFHINEEMWDNSNPDVDTIELVRYDVLSKDENFCKYIRDSNNRIGRNQTIGLLKIAAYCNDTKLKESRQAEYRKKCLELWKIPDKMRQAPEKVSNEALLAELLDKWRDNKIFLSSPAKELTSIQHLKSCFASMYNWYFLPIGRGESERNVKTFFLCRGGRDVYIYTSSNTWQQLRDVCLEITPKSLFYGEIVTEMIGESRSQNKVHALHIIDGIILGGKDIRRYSLKERLKMCEKFAKALNKPYIAKLDGMHQPVAPIRSKRLFPLIELKSFFDQMKTYKLKDSSSRLGYRIRSDDTDAERFFVPGGLMFLNENSPQYTCHLSKRSNLFYYLDTTNGRSFYIQDHKNPGEIYASFKTSFLFRLIWKWVNIHQVEENLEEVNKETDLLHRVDFYQYLQDKLMA